MVGVDSNGWVCAGVHKNLCARYLLCQAKSRYRIPVQIPGPQGTWDKNSANNMEVRPRGRNYCPSIKPTFNLKNGFIYCCGHKSTQGGKYDLGLLTHHPINREYKQRKMFLFDVEVLSMLVLLQFLPPKKKFIHYLCIIHLRVIISVHDVNACLCLDLLYDPDWHFNPCFWDSPSLKNPPPPIFCGPGVLGFHRVHS